MTKWGNSSETDPCVVTENNLYPKDSSIYSLQGNMIGRDEKNGPRGMGINEGIAFTLNTVDKQAVATVFSRQRTDVYMENDVTSTQVARQNKDATDLVLEQSFALDCRNIRELTEISGTLMAKEGGGYSLNFQNPIRKGYIVRRLTPTECERLQGFRDGWTAFGHDGKPLSDSARYRALGNSVAIPCVAYVLSGIVDELQREQEGFDDDIRT